jgi:hypothetical protein
MKINSRATVVLLLLLLAACATDAPSPRSAVRPDPAATPADSMQPATAIAPPTPPPPAPSADEIKRQLALQKREADDEAQRLAPYQKNLFQVFRLSETLAGFKPKRNAVGVYELPVSRSARLRLALAQLPNSPAKLSTGTYVVSLDLEIAYTEKQECVAGACAGTTEAFERSANKLVQIILTPKNNFSASATLPLADAKAAAAGRSYRTSYSNLVLTVRRMTASTPAAKGAD